MHSVFLRVRLCTSGPFILRFFYCLIALMFLFCKANFLLWGNKGLTWAERMEFALLTCLEIWMWPPWETNNNHWFLFALRGRRARVIWGSASSVCQVTGSLLSINLWDATPEWKANSRCRNSSSRLQCQDDEDKLSRAEHMNMQYKRERQREREGLTWPLCYANCLESMWQMYCTAFILSHWSYHQPQPRAQAWLMTATRQLA